MPNFESIREYPRKIINFFKNEETVDDSRLILPAEILHSKKCNL